MRYSDQSAPLQHSRPPQSRQSGCHFLLVTVSPGFCDSSLRRNLEPGPLLEHIEKMLAIAFTTEEAGRQLVFGAVVDEEENKLRASKAFIMKSKLHEPSDWVLSEDGKRAGEKI
ncbi:hypothetical protein D9758_008153 [Tetrapyrgos nigripes]|uniref:Uncharacterized protein n=1 Tax=Tetrapyrgos nigripes TaxID=182062 RepID=A0A8H5GHQ9_9AGAR|nr:hypothetical protein D9758_008153 [Tetrapyrgos nigripes]